MMEYALFSAVSAGRRTKRVAMVGATMLCLAVYGGSAQAQPSWRIVKKYLQPAVEVVSETQEALVLRHPDWQDTLVFTTAWRADADVYGMLGYRRGGNPYRIWKATERFWNDPDRPRPTWGRFFRAEFLRLIRPPRLSEREETGR